MTPLTLLAPLPNFEAWFDDFCQQLKHRSMLDIFADHLNYDFERTQLMAETEPRSYEIALNNLTEALEYFVRDVKRLDAQPDSATEQYVAALTLAISAQIEKYRHLNSAPAKANISVCVNNAA